MPLNRFLQFPNFKMIAIILLCVSLLSSFLFYYTPKEDTVNIHLFPKTIGPWTSEELTITEDEYAILETRNAFVRRYTNQDSKEQVYLYIVFSQNNRKVAHPPEICYTGSGLTIVETKDVTLNTSPQPTQAKRLILEKKSFRHMAYYWFKVADTFTPHYWSQQILIAIKTLLGQPASSALVRLSVDIKDDQDILEKSKTIEHFAQDILNPLYNYL